MNLPNGYEYTVDGLYFNGEQIANFIVSPSVLYYRHRENIPFACDIDIRCGDTETSLSRVFIKDLTDDWWETSPPGCWYNPRMRRPGKFMKVIFENCFDEAQRKEVEEVTEIGWFRSASGKMCYVTGTGAIGASPEDGAIWPPARASELEFETEEGCSIEEALEYFWELFKAIPGLTDVLLAYALTSFLSPIFREAGQSGKFPIILEGDPGWKKTTLACLACGAFSRRTNPRACKVGLNSTRCAVEQRANEMRHCTLIVDDLFPDGGHRHQEKALSLIRDYANQDPREVKSGKVLINRVMDCGMVITAEFFPRCGKSTRTRCLRLKLKEQIPNDLIYPLQIHSARLSNVFEEFIRRVAERYDEVTGRVIGDFQRYRMIRSTMDTDDERLKESAFFLYEALTVLLAVFPNDAAEDILYWFERRINNLAQWQLSPEATLDHHDIASAICKIHRQYAGDFIEHHGLWCIRPEMLCVRLRQSYGDPSIDSTFVIKCLREKLALRVDKSGVATKKIKGIRYLHIIPSRLG